VIEVDDVLVWVQKYKREYIKLTIVQLQVK